MKMEHLNLFHSKQKVLILSIGILFSFESATAGSLSLFNPLDIPKQPKSLYVNTQTLLSNDAFSLEGLFNDFNGRFYEKNSDYLSIGDIRYDVGTYIDGWGYIGYTYRKEAVIESSPDTMVLVNQASNDLDLTHNKIYELGLTLEGFEVHGITFANTIPLYKKNGWDIRLGFAGELLYGTETQHGSIDGKARSLSDKDYTFTMHSLYLYTDNYLYDLDVDHITSYGYTTHLSLYASYNKFSLSIIVNDLYGKLYWKNLPYSDVNLASENKSYDENGYVKYAPTISGVERSTKFTQKLMKKWRIQGAYTLNKEVFQLGTEYIYDTYLPYIKYTHKYDRDLIASVEYETYFGMFGVDVNYKNYYIGVHTNGIQNASSLKINLGLHYAF